MKIDKLNAEQQEFFDYFFEDYGTELKEEFLELADRVGENKCEGGILEGEDFKEYCLDEFNDYCEHLRTKHSDSYVIEGNIREEKEEEKEVDTYLNEGYDRSREI